MIYLITDTGHAYTNDEIAAQNFEKIGFKRVDVTTYKKHTAKCRRMERREIERERRAERKTMFDETTAVIAAEAIEEAKAIIKGDA